MLLHIYKVWQWPTYCLQWRFVASCSSEMAPKWVVHRIICSPTPTLPSELRCCRIRAVPVLNLNSSSCTRVNYNPEPSLWRDHAPFESLLHPHMNAFIFFLCYTHIQKKKKKSQTSKQSNLMKSRKSFLLGVNQSSCWLTERRTT